MVRGFRVGALVVGLVLIALTACGGKSGSNGNAQSPAQEKASDALWKSCEAAVNQVDPSLQNDPVYEHYTAQVNDCYDNGGPAKWKAAQTASPSAKPVLFTTPYGYKYDVLGGWLTDSHTLPGGGAAETPNSDVVYMKMSVTNLSGQPAPSYSQFSNRITATNSKLPQCSDDIAQVPVGCQGGIGSQPLLLTAQSQEADATTDYLANAGATYTMYVALEVPRGAGTDGISFFITTQDGKLHRLSS